MDNNRVYSEDLIQKTDFAPIFRLTYLWLSVGVAIVFLGGYLLAASGILEAIYSSGNPFIISMIGLFGMIGLSVAVQKQVYNDGSATKSMVYFVLYCVLLAFLISPVFGGEDPSTIYLSFISTAGIFFVMTIAGFVTKKDLSGFAGVLYAAFLGILIMIIVSLFATSALLNVLIAWFVVVISSALIAVKTNYLKRMALEMEFDENPQLTTKLSIAFALSLLISLVNIFLYLLRIFGRRR